MDEDRPYFNIDYDRVIMLGNKFNGTVMNVRKPTNKVVFPTVSYTSPIQPFYFDEPYIEEFYFGSLVYKRVGETHIFYCP